MHALKILLRLFRAETPWLLAGSGIALLTLVMGFALLAGAGASMAGVLGLASSALLLRGVALGRTASRYVERLVTHEAIFRILARLRLWFFRQAVPLAPARLGFSHSGDLLNRVVADIDALDALYLRIMVPLGLLLFAFVAGGMAVFFVFGSLAAAVFTLLLFLFSALVAGVSFAQASAASAESVTHLATLRTHTVDGLLGMPELVAFDAAAHQQSLMARATSRLVRAQLAVARALSASSALTALASTTILLALLLLVPRSSSSAPLLLGVMILSELMILIPNAFISFGKVKAAAERVVALARQPPAVIEPVCPPDSPTPPPLPPFSLSPLRFESVSLQYEGRPVPALQGISFTLQPGEQVMVTGPSGAGKSSLATLLLKFASPTAGRLVWGGIDIANLPGEVVRAHIGYLSQRTTLLSGTVRDNLLLAAPDAGDDRLWHALEAVEMEDVVRALPQGLDTWIGEGGVLLSGGQARRIALALVVLKDSPLWILDEPTEGLDDATAHALTPTLARLSRGHTLLFITHHPELSAPLGITRALRLEEGQLAPATPPLFTGPAPI